MTPSFNDENWVRSDYAYSTKVPFPYPTDSEKAALKDNLWRFDKLNEEERLFGAGLALMILSGESCQSKLICSWAQREGRYIDLTKNVYVMEFYLPEDAAKPVDDHYFHKIDSQTLEIPISPEISYVLRDSGIFGQLNEFPLGELLPNTEVHLWARLQKRLPRHLIKNRKGQLFFRTWIASEISERLDKEAAFSLTRFQHFSPKHSSYYPTYCKDDLLRVMSEVQEAMFGLPIPAPEQVGGYLGSHLCLKSWVLEDWFDKFYQEFPLDDNWRNYGKEKLERYRNQLACGVWIALASNFALRYCSNDVIEPLLNNELSNLTKILDKKVNKNHPERWLPVTTITKSIVHHFRDVNNLVKRKYLLPIDKHQLTLINLEQRSSTLLQTQHINTEIFGGIDAPANTLRHFIASKLKAFGYGSFTQTVLGHRPDEVHVPNPDILYSPAGGELAEAIAKIQSEVIGLRARPCKNLHHPDHKKQFQNSLDKNAEEALSFLWAITKPKHVLQRIAKHEVTLEKHGCFHILLSESIFFDFASDEEVALIQSLPIEQLKTVSTIALKQQSKANFTPVIFHEHFGEHIRYYSHACNYIAAPCLDSLFSPLPQLEHSLPVFRGGTSLIKCPGLCLQRLQLIISVLQKDHQQPIMLLKKHLIETFGLGEYHYLDVDALLNIIQSIHDSAEITIYRYMLYKMIERERSDKERNVASSTWETEYTKVYKRLMKKLKYINGISMMSADDVASYRKDFLLDIENDKKLSSETRQSMQYIINGLFSLMGSEPVNFHKGGKRERVSRPKGLIWPFQYTQVLNAICSSDLSADQKMIARAAVVLMYKAGIRPSELHLITGQDISDSLRIVTNAKTRTKTPAGNRICRCSVAFNQDEKAILKQVCAMPDKQSNKNIFKHINLSLLNSILKSVTQNPDACLYYLRYSFANFHYLLIMQVPLPHLREYFSSEDLPKTLASLKALWTIKGYEEEAILKALSQSLGHANVSTTMNSYICTLPWVRLYYRARAPLLSGRKMADLLKLSHTTYVNNKRNNEKHIGVGIGTRHVSDSNVRAPLIKVQPISYGDSAYCPLFAKSTKWQSLLDSGDPHFQAVIKKEAQLFGLKLNELNTKLAQEATRRCLTYFNQLPDDVIQSLYEEWTSKCTRACTLTSSIANPGFIDMRKTLNLEFRLRKKQYVFRGKTVGLNKNIATALLLVWSKVSPI